MQLVAPTNQPGTPKLVGEYYVINGRSYVRASNVVDALAPEQNLLDKIRKEGWEWWDEAGKAADFGTAVHAECEKLNRYVMYRDAVLDAWDGNPPTWPKHQVVNGQLKDVWIYGPPHPDGPLVFRTHCPVTGKDLRPFILTYARWLLADVWEVIHAELTIWSEKYGFAGTFDVLVRLMPWMGRLGDLIALVDLKTSKRLSWGYRLQTAAYVQALKESLGILADIRLIVNIPSDKGGEKLKLVTYGGGWQKEDFTTFWGALRLYRYRDHYKLDWRM